MQPYLLLAKADETYHCSQNQDSRHSQQYDGQHGCWWESQGSNHVAIPPGRRVVDDSNGQGQGAQDLSHKFLGKPAQPRDLVSA